MWSVLNSFALKKCKKTHWSLQLLSPLWLARSRNRSVDWFDAIPWLAFADSHIAESVAPISRSFVISADTVELVGLDWLASVTSGDCEKPWVASQDRIQGLVDILMASAASWIAQPPRSLHNGGSPLIGWQRFWKMNKMTFSKWVILSSKRGKLSK